VAAEQLVQELGLARELTAGVEHEPLGQVNGLGPGAVTEHTRTVARADTSQEPAYWGAQPVRCAQTAQPRFDQSLVELFHFCEL
jgi:hypothetical protein